jgi:hypothetical protein
LTALVLDTAVTIHSTTVAAGVQSIIVNGFAAAGDGGGGLYARTTTITGGPGVIQSADGAFWLLSSLPINVLQLGADPTGVNSSASAFNGAIAWANARATMNAGVDIVVPDGNYLIDADLTAISAQNVFIRGSRGAVLNIKASGAPPIATGSVFTWTGAGGGIFGMTMQYPASPPNTAVLITISGGSKLEFHDLYVSNINTLCVLGTDSSHTASNILFDNVTGNVFNSGQPTFDLRWGSDLTLIAVGLFVDKVDPPSFDRTSTMATVAHTNFIQCVNGNWDTLFLSGGCNTNRYWSAVYVNAPGIPGTTPAGIIQNFILDNSFFDYCSSDAISLNSPSNGMGGGVFLVSCRGCYIVSWSGRGIVLTGNNLNEIHDFTGSTIYVAGTHAVQLSGSLTRTIRLNTMRINNPNRLAGNYAGIRVDQIFGNWEVIGGSCLSDPSGGFPTGWSATFGVDIAAGNDLYTIQGANYVGSTANYNVASDTLVSKNRLITNNVQAAYAGFNSSGIFVKPASGSSWVNTSPFVVTVTAAGMTLLNMDGVSFAPLTGGTWDVPPGHNISVSYSGASTMLFFVKP